jgi:hypothetical protein
MHACPGCMHMYVLMCISCVQTCVNMHMSISCVLWRWFDGKTILRLSTRPPSWGRPYHWSSWWCSVAKMILRQHVSSTWCLLKTGCTLHTALTMPTCGIDQHRLPQNSSNMLITWEGWRVFKRKRWPNKVAKKYTRTCWKIMVTCISAF